MLAVSAMSPVDNLSSALELLDMQNLLDDHQGFDLSASFTYLGGAEGDDNDVDEKVYVQGTYNLLSYIDGKGKVKTGSFNKTKEFTSHGVVNFTGSGGFSARGGGADWEGYFNGGSSTDFVFEADGGYAFGIREHEFSGHFKGHDHWGQGNIEVNVWQHVNISHNSIEYNFGGDKHHENYQGTSKGSADTTTPDSNEYKSFFKSVFHGSCADKSWQVSGGYVLDVYNSKWENVWSKDGGFSKNGTQDEVLGTFSNIRSFGLPSSGLISE